MNRIREIRKARGLTMKELGAAIGLAESTISQYETGKRQPDNETLLSLAEQLGVTVGYLLGAEESATFYDTFSLPGVSRPPCMVKKPRLGTIACGRPILAVEEAEEYDDVMENIECDFTLCYKGDSMINARIYDGDIVYIRAQEQVENGEIAAVRIGDEATLKRVYYNGARVILRACNPLYDDLEYEGAQLNEIQVMGKAIAFTSMIR